LLHFVRRVVIDEECNMADSTGVRKELGEFLGWFHVSECLAGAVVETRRDAGQVFGGVDGQVGAFGQVLAQQPVDASMSSGEVPGDVVLPGGVVGGHGPVDDVDEMALQDPARAAGAFDWFVACQQLLGCWAEALLHDGRGVKDAQGSPESVDTLIMTRLPGQ
jgi:hypothetical protein